MLAWTAKDRRQYEHVRDVSLERGVRVERAEEIAARTVDRHRREEGRATDDRAPGTGNPNRPLEERSKDELYSLARGLKIEGRSRMSKDDLVSAIRKAG